MTLPGGGFASSLGAVSEGGEGRYYLWEETEIDRLLGPDAALFKRAYGVTPQGNFEGRNVLNRIAAPAALARGEEETLRRCRAKLLDRRNERPRPQRDEKVLADWNGLAISALVKAGVVFDGSAWVERAREAFDFVVRHLTIDSDLYHAWYRERLQSVRILDDYAQMARAALSLYEATDEHAYLEQCERWVDTCITLFADREGGALAFSADASLAARLVDGRDGATPSAMAPCAKCLRVCIT